MSSFKIRHGSIAAVCMLSPLVCAAHKVPQAIVPTSYLSFQVPDSPATYPLSINDAMVITGYYITNAGVTAGFVRSEDGSITTFEVAGAVLTEPVSINTAGDITGWYEPASQTLTPQGFVRTADGTITTFGNTMGATNSSSFWAQPAGINVAGEIVGNDPGVAYGSRVFLRSPSGVISGFTLSFGTAYSTIATGVNAGGAVIGYESSENIDLAQGFLWSGNGSVPTPGADSAADIMAPGSTGTFPTAINTSGTIVGCFAQQSLFFDFVRDPDGTITTLDVPGAIPGCLAGGALGFYNVAPPSITINDAGTIVGSYTNAAKVPSGFVKPLNGEVMSFTYPGATSTIPTSINTLDAITGYYSTASGTQGFIIVPSDCEHLE